MTKPKRRINAEGLELIKRFEGRSLKAYQDPIGIWTIGYGHIKGVKQGDVISVEQADQFLTEDLEEAEGWVNFVVEVPVNYNEFSALVSFTYNVGPGNLVKSTLLKLLNGDATRAVVAEQFLRWNKAGGKVLPGLTRRRAAERVLFLKPVGDT